MNSCRVLYESEREASSYCVGWSRGREKFRGKADATIVFCISFSFKHSKRFISFSLLYRNLSLTLFCYYITYYVVIPGEGGRNYCIIICPFSFHYQRFIMLSLLHIVLLFWWYYVLFEPLLYCMSSFIILCYVILSCISYTMIRRTPRRAASMRTPSSTTPQMGTRRSRTEILRWNRPCTLIVLVYVSFCC